MSHNIDGMPRGEVDLLEYVMLYGTVERIVTTFALYRKEVNGQRLDLGNNRYAEFQKVRGSLDKRDILFEPYDLKEKEKIYLTEINPVLQTVFEAEQWQQKFPFATDLIEFLTNFVWCSRLRLPFVVDLHALRWQLPLVRDGLVASAKIKDPRPLNELIALVDCYRRTNLAFFEPRPTRIGTAMEIWDKLRLLPEFCEVGAEHHQLGKKMDLRSIKRRAARARHVVSKTITG